MIMVGAIAKHGGPLVTLNDETDDLFPTEDG